MVAFISPAGRRPAFVLRALLFGFLIALCAGPARATDKLTGGSHVIDLSLLIAPEYPCTWPTFPPFQINHYQRIGPLGPFHNDIVVIDGNTGTQLDVPPHSVAPPESSLPNAGPFGRTYTETIPAWQLGGEACVIDCRDLCDSAPPGHSPLIRKERVIAWEKEHRPLGPGDVVLFNSGFSDAYYKALPEGRRFGADPLEAKAPAWPGPDPECMEYLAGRKVMTLGIDSTSMGPVPDLGEPTHYAGLKHGMIWTESNIGLGGLPPTGAFYCIMSPKYAGGIYSECRTLAIVGDPLARRLIDAARNKKVVDLSMVLSEDLPLSWPGRGVGNHRQPLVKPSFGLNPNTRTAFDMHMLDTHTGTHLVPPAYSLPEEGFDNKAYAPQVREWLAEYEKKFGPRGTSDTTTEKVPLSHTCGPARVIDTRHLVGSTDRKSWPASPDITAADIQKHEKEHGVLRAGDIVIFQSGWTDQYCHPAPLGKACMEDPLNGKSEGWPAPGPEAVFYLGQKGIRCIATDAPTLGGADPKRALMTYWALGSNGMVGVEFLTHVGQMPKHAYFLFAAVKIRGGHGGHGRAIAIQVPE
jgi:kynurenine formamidase